MAMAGSMRVFAVCFVSLTVAVAFAAAANPFFKVSGPSASGTEGDTPDLCVTITSGTLAKGVVAGGPTGCCGSGWKVEN